MASFTTRVVLHNATFEDYEKLHEQMEARKFTRKIKGADGTTYTLPDAEYRSISSTLDAAGVRQLAVDAASKTRRNHAVFVTMSTTDSCAWVGLEAVE
ncbi:hypothetical protein [Pseudomonas sp. BF-R-12]|uniref:hypothetical protein n=1 Tax=Pseudomonas sp. BF-R-12 TaxID=2832363 RepID=UPI001CBAAD2F|nr:hypothetical protein [Pseudomonas sp. BF-R-12]